MRFRQRKLSPHPWRWPQRPRVLLENPDGDAGLVAAAALRRAGYAVAICPGPVEEGRPPGRCPLVAHEGCALADGADVIVTSLGLDYAENQDVVRALRAHYPETPLVVEAPPEAAGRYPELLEGCDVVASPAAPEALVAAVRKATERGQALSPAGRA